MCARSGRRKRRKVEAGIHAYQSLARGFAEYMLRVGKSTAEVPATTFARGGPATVRDFARGAVPGCRTAMSLDQAGHNAPRQPDNLKQ